MNKWIRWEQLFQLVMSHTREIIREPEVIFWGVIFPMLMSLGLGIAFTQKPDIVRNVALIESSQTSASAPAAPDITKYLPRHTEQVKSDPGGLRYELIQQDGRMGNTTFIFIHTGWDNAMTLMKRGFLSVAITEDNGRLHYHFDPANTDAQLTYLKLSKILSQAPAPTEGNDNIYALTVRGTRYIDFLVPGLIAMGIMMSCLWGISYGVIEKRSQKLLRRMIATPMKKSHFLVSLMSVRIALNLIESTLLFIFAYLVFDISIQGNPAALFLVFFAGNIAFSGIAVFVCSRTGKTETGNGLINVVVMPMMVLSGIFFSYHNFPEWSHPVIRKLPLTLLADGLRTIFIEGAGFTEACFPAVILTAIGLLFFTAGLKIFKWH